VSESAEAWFPPRSLSSSTPERIIEMLRDQADDLQKPPVTFEELLARLTRSVPDLVDAVREYLVTRRRVTAAIIG
jgi:hypothetical protein